MTKSELHNIISDAVHNALNEYMDCNLSKVRMGLMDSDDDFRWAYEPDGDDRTQVVKNQWMIHFGDIKTVRGIARNGFTMGNDVNKRPEEVTYNRSKIDRGGKTNIFNYAYLASDVITTMQSRFDDTFLYYLSQEALDGFVMFKANGYRFYHSGDFENQVVFNNVQRGTIVEVQYLYNHYCVLDKNNFRRRHKPRVYMKGESGNRLGSFNPVNPKSEFDGILYASRDIEKVIEWVMINFKQYRNRIGN